MAVAVVVGLATVGSLGLSGIALGLSAGAWFEASALGILLWQRTPGAGLENVARPLVVFIAGAVLAASAAFVIVRLTDPLIGPDPGKIALLGQVLAGGVAAAAVYALYALLLRIPELSQSISLALSILRRGKVGEHE
jgi:peptidoglycan biosynthesis protein MviN/MurJ (putative lipid II flippase)